MERITRWLANFVRMIAKRNYTINTTIQYSSPNQRFAGKRVVVIGATGGIGFAMAKAFSAEGATVLMCGRNEAKLKQLSDTIKTGVVKLFMWNVVEVDAIKDKIKEAETVLGGPCDIFLNCAGAATDDEIYRTGADYDYVMDINQKALYFLTENEAKYFVACGRPGKIVNITSRACHTLWCDPYVLSKWGAECITRGCARKYCGHGVAINGIAPGPVLTNIAERMRTKLEKGDMSYDIAGTKRTTTPGECAELAMFLCSGSANNIIGQNIVIDGGIYG